MDKFDFNEVNLIPNKCIVNSRSECITNIILGKYNFKMPIVPANMECVINENIAIKLAKSGYFYIMHRFDIDPIIFTENMKRLNLISSISLGVNSDSYQYIDTFEKNNLFPDFITIDIAHGHSIKMEKMLKYIKEKLPETFVIAGNVSTPQAIIDLEEWGADACKVGIGPGSSCTTWPSTGFGSRNCQAHTIYNCSKYSTKPIIADGGIKVPGDISKSLALGASMVMIGGMLSGFNDSPGDLISTNEGFFKEFWGSASAFQSGKKNRIEGRKNLIPFKDKSLFDELKYIEECLQSSISYAGGSDLSAFKKVKWF